MTEPPLVRSTPELPAELPSRLTFEWAYKAYEPLPILTRYAALFRLAKVAAERLQPEPRRAALRLLFVAEHAPVGAEFDAALAEFDTSHAVLDDDGDHADAAVMETVAEIVLEGGLSLAGTILELRYELGDVTIHRVVRSAVGETFDLRPDQQEVAARLLADGTPLPRVLLAARNI
jgi:hypothetical protein